MSFDHSKLVGRVVEKFGTRKNFAREMRLSEQSISRKLNGENDFTQTEILRASRILCIPSREIPTYFFAPKV